MINIAIDGPSGAGKSTIARFLAKKMNIAYLDTGAMYRGLAYYTYKKNILPDDIKKVLKLLQTVTMDIVYKDGEQNVIVCNENVTPFIREHHISMLASTISKIPEVRAKLVELQRDISKITDCVLDGRDIGSHVLPNANFKFYITATTEERAKRRYEELIKRGVNVEYETILADVKSRDYQDMNRTFAPLKVCDDAFVIDTTVMSIEAVCDMIYNIVCPS